jgi:hypothetical protein
VRKYRIFVQDRHHGKYSALRDVFARTSRHAVQTGGARNQQSAKAIKWPPQRDADWEWLEVFVGPTKHLQPKPS